MRTGTSSISARRAARKRRAPATISKPSLLGRTVIGWISPWVRRLSAFCAAHRFVAEDAKKCTEADGPRSKGYITDERDPIAT
jgi:hypothetical protein